MKTWPGNAWMQAHQIALYLTAIAAGCVFGLVLSSASKALEFTVNPILGLLLYATFLSMPLTRLPQAFRDIRFMGALCTINFVVVPIVAFGLSRLVAGEQPLLFGVLLVLLAPCIDYVIVFTGLAGGDSQRLLAATPLLLILQMVLVPAYLYLFAGPSAISMIVPGPFLMALLGLITLPLLAAALTQALSTRFARMECIGNWADYLMVPLMMGTLFCVVGSQIYTVQSSFAQLALGILVFVLFIGLMNILGYSAGKLFQLPMASLRAATFSGVTRNSLVVLPLALALPAELELASAVVVSQTLVELLGMLVMVRFTPKQSTTLQSKL